MLLAAAAIVAAALAHPAAAAPEHDAGAAESRVYSSVNVPAVRSLARAGAVWGGRVTSSTGEVVRLFISDAYPVDPAVSQRWANLLTSLVHGPEISTLTAYIVTPAEVDRLCSPRARACYLPELRTLVAPGEPSDERPPEAALMHEYGHHVAASRLNAPWPAVDYGTKRWASYLQVCARVRSGDLSASVTTLREYRVNPGETFAETYRLLNERRLGRPESPWEVVHPSLYPDETALALLEQDVTTPWRANASSTIAGSLARAGATRSHAVAATLDGSLRVTVRATPRAPVRIELYGADGGRVASATTTRTRTAATVQTTVCGSRSFSVRVRQVAGRGTYRLTVSKP